MASTYPKQGKYWLHFYDHVAGRWKDKPTELRVPEDARKARQLKNATTAAELKHKTNKVRHEERWSAWVPKYMRTRYKDGDTYNRYLNSWSHLEGFLEKEKITVPAAWKAEHNAAYVDWKEEQGYSREVAIWDLGTLAMLMNEAKRREFIVAHKVSKSRIKRGEKGEKPAVTDDQIATLRQGLLDRIAEATEKKDDDAKERWKNLATGFEISLHTGCRLAETAMPLDRINIERGTITFLPKGGKEMMFTVPIIFPAFKEWLAALCDQRRAEGSNVTCEMGKVASRDFGRLCRNLKVKGPNEEKVTFHCLRVNFVTRALEAGLSGEVVRRFVKHADVIINRLYQRFSIEGLQVLGARLNLPVVTVPALPDASFATPTPQKMGVSRPPVEGRQPSTDIASGKNNRARRQAPAG